MEPSFGIKALFLVSKYILCLSVQSVCPSPLAAGTKRLATPKSMMTTRTSWDVGYEAADWSASMKWT